MSSQYARADQGSIIGQAGRDLYLQIGERSPLDRAVEDLAGAVRRQWSREAEARSLLVPGAVRIRWSGPGDLSLADFWRTVASKQLVVVGDAASGKTSGVLLLTLDLLARRRPGDPVPVLLPISSWNPAEDLHRWAARRLAEDYPALTDRRAYGPDAPLRLVLQPRIVLVLDGLDELPPDLRRAAVTALNFAAAGDYPLIVTCRRADYEQMRSANLPLLGRAAVVAARPVDVESAAEFLTELRDRRWDAVAHHLRAHPRGRLAEVLSSPLMLQLARELYRDPWRHPGELLAMADRADRAQIESHLLGLVLPNAYRTRPRPPETVRAIPREPGYDPAKASRWLAFLARSTTPDLAWWTVKSAVPGYVFGLLAGLFTAVVAAVSWFGATLLDSPELVQRQPWMIVGDSALFALVSGAAAAKFLASAPRQPLYPSRLALGKAWAAPLRWAAAIARLVVGVGAFTAVVGALGLVALHQPWLLLFVLLFGSAVPAVLRAHVRWFDRFTRAPLGGWDASSPRMTLRRSRNAAYLVFASFVLCYTALAFTSPLILPWGVVFGTLFALNNAWGAYQVARFWLALRGRLPWRVMRFLDDAHRRELLARAGAVHQFRHDRLRTTFSANAS